MNIFGKNYFYIYSMKTVAMSEGVFYMNSADTQPYIWYN